MNDYYLEIFRKLDEHAAGAPKYNDDFSPPFIDYLKLLYTPEQAELVQHLSGTSEFYGSGFDTGSYTTAVQLSDLTGKGIKEIRELLNPLVEKNALMGNTAMGKGVIRPLFLMGNVLRVLQKKHGTSGCC